MERQLKERLVGAAVLMAMAVILIPEMLSGPRRAPAPSATPAAERNEGNLKRYTIDMNGTQVPEASKIAEDVPPAEEVPIEEALPEVDSAATEPAPPEIATAPPEESRAAAPVETPARTPIVQNAPEPEPPGVEAAAPAPVKAPAPVPVSPAPATTRRWVVQLMATASREEAQREAEDLRNGNYAAFVMPVQTGRSTLYRVRVGPFVERAQAEEALRKLKSVRSNPIVVAQP